LLRILRDFAGRSRADGLDLSIRDHERLVFLRCCARAINHADVLKNEDGRIDSYKRSDITRLLGLGQRNRTNEHRPT